MEQLNSPHGIPYPCVYHTMGNASKRVPANMAVVAVHTSQNNEDLTERFNAMRDFHLKDFKEHPEHVRFMPRPKCEYQYLTLIPIKHKQASSVTPVLSTKDVKSIKDITALDQSMPPTNDFLCDSILSASEPSRD
jgi:hypothetical protein